ncbi:MAG: cysteine desulfurase [Pirellulales bacterium]|nr:cysteine desulfurase [Pirellulales bacterium]
MSFDPENYRKDFPILGRVIHGDRPLVYLDNAASTQRPRQVLESIVDTYENHYANVHRGIHQLAQDADDRYEAAREKVRAFLGAAALEEIIFTSGTTGGINLVARCWGDANLREGDEILLTEMEHHSNLVPWQQLAARTGAVLRHIPLTDDGRLQLDALEELLGKKTKIVAFAAVSNVLGTIAPAKEIIRRAHEVGAVALVDGAQSVPHQKTDVAELDCDFLALSGHKMLGPTGIGVLYGKRELLAAMPPFLGGGSMIKEVHLDHFSPGELPGKFEAGTPPIVPAIALGAAIDYLAGVGLEAIQRHERQLTIRAHEVLGRVAGVRIWGPAPERKAGIVSFTMDRIHAHDVAQLLDRQGIAVRAGHHCAMPLHARFGVSATVRASFYFYNTLEEVEKLGEALEQLKDVFRPRKKVAK